MKFIDQYTKLGARLWARPKRVAFLVDESFETKDINNVVRYCLTHLGGRCNPIVPVEENHIGSGWESILLSLDPDVLYTFIPLSEDLRKHLNQCLRPSRIITAHSAHRHPHGWQISESEIGGIRLTDADLPFKKTILSSPSTPKIVFDDFAEIKDTPESFCLRNFGGFSEREWETFALESKGINLIPVSEITSPETFLATMLPSYGRLYPAQLSTAGVDRAMFRSPLGNSTETYEIVIGDSIRDFLYVWNRSTTLAFSWNRRALWLPANSIASHAMLSNAAQWLRECKSPNGHDVECKVLSYSIGEQELQAFAQKLQPQIYTRTSYSVLERDESCNMHGVSTSGCPSKSHRFEFGESDTAFGVPYPEQALYSKLSNQGWVVEIEFESPQSSIGSIFKNTLWHLPSRYRLDKKFVDHQQPSRISSAGHLVVEVSADKRTFPIKIPSAKELCDVLLVEPEVRDSIMKVGQFRRLDTSSDGQYLWSILRLFGSLQSAEQLFDDEGWRNVIFDMIGGERILKEEVHSSLEKFLREQGAPRGKAERELVKSLINTPSEYRYLYRSRIAKHLMDATSIFSDDEELLSDQLHYYLSRGIFLQGAASRCYYCGTKRWYRIDELKTTMSCQGCATEFSLQPIDAISFRLNDLVSNGIRRWGLLPVLQSLFALSSHARQHLIFLPQQDLFDWSDGEKQVTDLDLIGILDGEYFIGEVKSSEKELLKIDLNQLVEICLELRPNRILVAAPAPEFTVRVQEHCKKLIDMLKDTKTIVNVMPLRWTETMKSKVSSLEERISTRAYLNWQAGGSKHGNDFADWLLAEYQIKSEGNS